MGTLPEADPFSDTDSDAAEEGDAALLDEVTGEIEAIAEEVRRQRQRRAGCSRRHSRPLAGRDAGRSRDPVGHTALVALRGREGRERENGGGKDTGHVW